MRESGPRLAMVCGFTAGKNAPAQTLTARLHAEECMIEQKMCVRGDIDLEDVASGLEWTQIGVYMPVRGQAKITIAASGGTQDPEMKDPAQDVWESLSDARRRPSESG